MILADEEIVGARRMRVWHWVVLAVILAAGVMPRVYHLGYESLWTDELYSLQTSTGHDSGDLFLERDRVIERVPHLTRLDEALPVWRIWGSMGEDQHPPLYFILLRFWREFFGSGDVALRALSVVVSLGAVVAVFDVGRLLFGPGEGLWASAMMAVAQTQIVYAQEVKSYALLCLLGAVAAGVVVRIERFGLNWRRAVGLFGVMLALVLTHYLAVAVCVAVVGYAGVRLRGRERWRVMGVALAAGVVFAVIWGPEMLAQGHGYAIGDNWLSDRGAGRLGRLGWQLLVLPIRLFAEPPRRFVYGVVGFLLMVLPMARVKRVRGLLLPLMWAWGWIGMMGVIDLVRSTTLTMVPRFALGAAPAVYLLGAGIFADQRGRRGWMRHVLPGVLVIYCLASLPWAYQFPKIDFRGLGQDVGRLVGRDDLIIYHVEGIGDQFTGVPMLAVDHYAPEVSAAAVLATGPLRGEALERARRARRVWGVSNVSALDVERVVPGFGIRERHYAHGFGFLFGLERRGALEEVPAPAG